MISDGARFWPRLGTIGVGALLLGMACSACSPAMTSSSADTSMGGASDRDVEPEPPAPGAWAPVGSLARLEDLPRGGQLEERESLSDGVRLVVRVPLSEDGTRLLEVFGVPESDSQNLAIALRSMWQSARYGDCGRLVFEADDEPFEATSTERRQSLTSLGVRETITGRTTLQALRGAAVAGQVHILACEHGVSLPEEGKATLARFITRFDELRGPGEAAEPSATEEAAEPSATEDVADRPAAE